MSKVLTNYGSISGYGGNNGDLTGMRVVINADIEITRLGLYFDGNAGSSTISIKINGGAAVDKAINMGGTPEADGAIWVTLDTPIEAVNGDTVDVYYAYRASWNGPVSLSQGTGVSATAIATSINNLNNGSPGAANQSLGPVNFVYTIAGGGPPAAPTGPSATATSATTATVAWGDASSDETKFNLERKEEGGSYAEIAEPAANATSYNDTGLDPETHYYWKINAENAEGTSSFTAEVDAYTWLATPTDLEVTAVTGTGISINSTKVTAIGDSRRIKIATDSGLTSLLKNIIAVDDTTPDLGGLPEGQTLYIGVYAHDTNDVYHDSAVSNIVEFIVGLAAPTGLTATPINPTRVDLTWTNQTALGENILIERSPNGSTGWETLATIDGSESSYSDTDAEPSATNYYRVQAIKAGEGEEEDLESGYATANATTEGQAAPSGSVFRGRPHPASLRYRRPLTHIGA